MSNKLSDLDSLILETLEERIGSLPVVDADGVLKFGDDEIVRSNDKRYAKSFAQRVPPPDRLTVADIKQLLVSLRLGTPKSKPEARWQLQKAKELIAARGTEDDKANWHISLHLLQKNYNLARKISVENPLATYTVLDKFLDKNKFRKYAKAGTWIGLTMDPEPARDTANIEDREVSPQQIHSLFRTDMRNAGGEAGLFPPDVANAINTLFMNTNNLFQRIEVISELSNVLSDILRGDTDDHLDIQAKELQNYIAQSVLLDYFTSIVSEMDDGAGAYLFETFLAAMAGGKVEGKKKTAQGQMAATDFEFAGGEQGSAKYYSSTDGIGQAVGGFEPEVPMHYVVGIKNKEKSGDNTVIKSVDIYYFKVILVPRGRQPDGKFTNARAYAFNPDGEELSPREPWFVSGELKLNKSFLYSASTRLGTIDILGASAEKSQGFRKSLLQATQRINKDFAEVLAGLGNVAESASAVRQSTNKYAMDGESRSGDEAIQNLRGLNAFFGNLFNKLADMGYQRTQQDPTELKEEKTEKKSVSALDKLIEQVILYNNMEVK